MSGGAADARIRRFSAGVWLAGASVGVVVSLVTLPVLAVDPGTGQLYLEDPTRYEVSPWDDPQAGELEIVDGEIIGAARGGYIDLPADPEMWEIGPLTGTDEPFAVYQQLDVATSPDRTRPTYVRLLDTDRSITVLTDTTAGRLWFAPSLREWRAAITPRPGTPVASPMTGEGSAILIYEGEALSGRFTYSGDGFFQADAVLPGAVLDLVSGIDEVDARFSWPRPGRVAFLIEADEGTWSLTLDEPASVPPSTP